MNKAGKGAQWLFAGNVGLIYPDFISRNQNQRIIADAKYKPIDNIGNKDYLQVLAYMLRFNAKQGYYLYPENQKRDSYELRMNSGVSFEKNVLPREDIKVIKHGLFVPNKVSGYEEFLQAIEQSEKNFVLNLRLKRSC
jgi:5-methylcytosine-specific restriction endonuclease McrBC regulatory subunit McrC